MKLLAVFGFLFVSATLAATPAQWRGRAIYQVLTDRYGRTDGSTTAPCDPSARAYCGGTWRGIMSRLDYIQGMGFDAIWISPITANLPQVTANGEAYHGYWQQDLFAVNSHFGTPHDLQRLAMALHARRMYLMVDVVANHFGFSGPGNAVDYSQLHPFNCPDAFHSYCPITDYNNQSSVENCWLGDSVVSLPDVKTDDSRVASILQTWISQLVSNYSVDGLRIDTVKHVPKSFWPSFTAAAGVFSIGEVFDGDASYTCDYQNYMDGLLNYPLYYPLLRAFQAPRGNMQDLFNEINTVKSTCKMVKLAQNALAFVILADGIPIIYEGQEQHYSGNGDPANREAIWLSGYSRTGSLYTLLASLNLLRKRAISRSADYLTYKNWPIYYDATTIAMRKGFDGNQIITVLSNLGASGPAYTFSLGTTGFTPGQIVLEVLTCSNVTVDASSKIAVQMGAGLPKIYYPLSQLTGSGICGH
ncbi:MAG: hypothetical protein M1826_003588 [Phylliscum demangeonii]|nr:MAG: hypothetical protein M1826_003588 [Phylliscum demangeonii]